MLTTYLLKFTSSFLLKNYILKILRWIKLSTKMQFIKKKPTSPQNFMRIKLDDFMAYSQINVYGYNGFKLMMTKSGDFQIFKMTVLVVSNFGASFTFCQKISLKTSTVYKLGCWKYWQWIYIGFFSKKDANTAKINPTPATKEHNTVCLLASQMINICLMYSFFSGLGVAEKITRVLCLFYRCTRCLTLCTDRLTRGTEHDQRETYNHHHFPHWQTWKRP